MADEQTDPRTRRAPRRATGRPRRGEADGIDGTIRRAAVEVLLEHGEKASMVDVAAAAGLTRKSVYLRYSGKDELFVDAVRDLLARARSVELPADDDIEARLFAYFRTTLEIVSTPQSRAIQRLLVLNPSFVTALKADLQVAAEQQFVRPLRNLLAEADAAGALRVEDPERVARAIVNLFHAESLGLESREVVDDAARREDYARFLTRLFLDGLRMPG